MKDILDRIRAGDFEAAIGQLESIALECKRTPYRLGGDAEKLELVKDACGLANAGGGTLLIGFRTGRDPDFADDRILEATPFPAELIDPKQCQQIVAAWTWPKLEIEIELVKVPNQETHRIAIISVPQIPEGERPVLATAVPIENGKRTEKYVGYFERKRSDTPPTEAQQLHAWIAAGRRYHLLIKDELVAIREAMLGSKVSTVVATPIAWPSAPAEKLAVIERAEPRRINEQAIIGRYVNAISAVNIVGQPQFILMGVPSVRLDLPELLESDSRLTKLVSDPPRLRESGFNIDAAGVSRMLAGQSRQSLSSNTEVLELFRDGFALFAVRGDENGLCWAMSQRGQGRLVINPRALAEITYLFVLFLFEVYRDTLKADEAFEVRLRLASVEAGSEKFKLQSTLGRLREAPGWLHEAAVKAGPRDVPARITYEAIREIYAWFGEDSNRIPFTAIDGDGRRNIDPQLIVTR